MTREIIFRGKRLDNGEWVEGTPVWSVNNRCYMIIGAEEAERIDFLCQIEYVEVDPETIGQWTGITNVNGQRIFEGDIVRWRKFADKEYQISIMKWFEQCAAFGLTRSIDDGAIWVSDWFGIVFWGGDMEVIGNIWDNKGLLKTE